MSNDYLSQIAQLQAALPGWSRQQIVEGLNRYQQEQALHAPMLPHVVPMHKSIADHLDMSIKEAPSAGENRHRMFMNRVNETLDKALNAGLSPLRCSDLRAQCETLGKSGQYEHDHIHQQLQNLITRELKEDAAEDDRIEREEQEDEALRQRKRKQQLARY
ncbi:hypothetical protein ACFA67_004551 [Salmonella enterica]